MVLSFDYDHSVGGIAFAGWAGLWAMTVVPVLSVAEYMHLARVLCLLLT